jgi:chromosome segregation protein
MLNALELIGFKSFADKTRFEFPPGITVIVGPNGSGKSNIVDAIKWVLGEQSAKSLRGKDMADVIFKGAGPGGRKAMNTAEATIFFDNSDGRLAIDSQEVRITRRVYRSGEGEYLINAQPCRLKDIKDLFRGTGVGADAYSLIEQGKVDNMLQASPRDRRALFEEAAGISRFKAKKVETQRRLERVEQNLIRLSDIVEEVEGRLRSVRAQASKARRYKQYADRLQQLRTHVALTDWRHLSARLQQLESQLEHIRGEAENETRQADVAQQGAVRIESETARVDEAIHRHETSIARDRERIAATQSQVDHQRSRFRELDDEAVPLRRQLAATTARTDEIEHRWDEAVAALDRARSQHAELSIEVSEQEQAIAELSSRIKDLVGQSQSRRHEYFEQVRLVAALGNQVASCESQQSAARATSARRKSRLEELERDRQEQQKSLTALEGEQRDLVRQAEQAALALSEAQGDLADSRKQLAQLQEELAALASRLSAATERAAVLRELESRSEGISSGVRDVMARAASGDGQFAGVIGLVADLLRVSVKLAPLVDVALGETARCVVVSGDRLIEALASGQFKPTGRVGVLRIDALHSGVGVAGAAGETSHEGGAEQPSRGANSEMSQHGDELNLNGRPGVMGRADRLVEYEAFYAPLFQHLLGDTWFVESLAHGLALRAEVGRPFRFVTLDGELLDQHGTLTVGPRNVAAGIISRRSQLRALDEEIRQLGRKKADSAAVVEGLKHDMQRLDAEVVRMAEDHQRAATSAADARVRTRAVAERCALLESQYGAIAAEWRAAQVQVEAAERELAAFQQRLDAGQTRLAEIEADVAGLDESAAEWENERQQLTRQATLARVRLAKSEERLETLRQQVAQHDEAREERARRLRDLRTQIEKTLHRRDEADAAVLRATAELAELYLAKERMECDVARCRTERATLAQQRVGLLEEVQRRQQALRHLQQRQHNDELAAGEVRHQRGTLVERLRDDYGIEIGELEQHASHEDHRERDQIEEEIATLRRKINSIGAVNLEALAEVEDLEARHAHLAAQYQDLCQARDALQRIITKINTDSRRLFQQTLEAVRANFQTLYRKAFGGGRADLVVEEGTDPLEAGIEIVATPPGKPQFSNSLLSGGERALTAVALLLAIFQYRPSPFCLLDEVDAPFDEANIGRFIEVLGGFLGWTKFVLVTHSKKTMTAATTLYGVTMQESGVSKRVSVMFDDVSDDGHIRREAIERQTALEASSKVDEATDDERGAA